MCGTYMQLSRVKQSCRVMPVRWKQYSRKGKAPGADADVEAQRRELRWGSNQEQLWGSGSPAVGCPHEAG